MSGGNDQRRHIGCADDVLHVPCLAEGKQVISLAPDDHEVGTGFPDGRNRLLHRLADNHAAAGIARWHRGDRNCKGVDALCPGQGTTILGDAEDGQRQSANAGDGAGDAGNFLCRIRVANGATMP